MKNKLALLVSAALCASLAIPATAGAAETIDTPTQKDLDVTVAVDSSNLVNAGNVFSVDIAWDSLEFAYAFNNEPETTWDPTTHTYYSTDGYPFVAGTWLRRAAGDEYSRTNSDITVTNHSNTDVAVSAVFKDSATPLSSTVDNVTATLKNANFDLATGEGRTADQADAQALTVSIEGTPNTTQGFKLGTVTLTIAAKK